MTNRDATDAVSVLTADHESVRRLFSEFEELVAAGAGDAARRALAEQICDALTAHAAAEEELLYPAARDALEDDFRIDQAQGEHEDMRALIRQIRSLDAVDGRHNALVAMLASVVAAHVRQEEGDLFPRLEFTSLDLGRLGEQLVQRRTEALALLAKVGG